MQRAIEARHRLKRELERAIERREFSVHYQPIIDLESGAPVAVEALVRWNHPTRGSVSPADFIPFAEESGLIVQIGELVLEDACRQASVLGEWSQGEEPLGNAHERLDDRAARPGLPGPAGRARHGPRAARRGSSRSRSPSTCWCSTRCWPCPRSSRRASAATAWRSTTSAPATRRWRTCAACPSTSIKIPKQFIDGVGGIDQGRHVRPRGRGLRLEAGPHGRGRGRRVRRTGGDPAHRSAASAPRASTSPARRRRRRRPFWQPPSGTPPCT